MRRVPAEPYHHDRHPLSTPALLYPTLIAVRPSIFEQYDRVCRLEIASYMRRKSPMSALPTATSAHKRYPKVTTLARPRVKLCFQQLAGGSGTRGMDRGGLYVGKDDQAQGTLASVQVTPCLPYLRHLPCLPAQARSSPITGACPSSKGNELHISPGGRAQWRGKKVRDVLKVAQERGRAVSTAPPVVQGMHELIVFRRSVATVTALHVYGAPTRRYNHQGESSR